MDMTRFMWLGEQKPKEVLDGEDEELVCHLPANQGTWIYPGAINSTRIFF